VRSWSQFNLELALYAVLSLTVVRMLPVAIALIGTRLSTASVVFMGWFGPRGLASICRLRRTRIAVLCMLAEEGALPHASLI